MKALAAAAVALGIGLAASGCSGSDRAARKPEAPPSQALRRCVDRWDQDNMVGWGPAPVNIAFRRPVAKERASIALSLQRRCIVSIRFGNDGTLTCVLTNSGAYWCPPRHEPTGPALTHKNAVINRRGALVLDSPLKGTKPTAPLAWQRYPHIDGFILPWSTNGTLRPGLIFVDAGRGGCFRVDETARSAISCISSRQPDLGRYDACFPQRRNWQAGDLAACGALGDTRFTRWTITARH